MQEIGLEFIPTPTEEYIRDKTAMDAFVRYLDKNGNNYLISIETKYTDSLGTNAAFNHVYQLDIMRELEKFTNEAFTNFDLE